ncbi:MAG: GNAT family N-acetyltransferase [Acidobacteria bacterium]|nr:MAG: GNAT family N-acetyltransferase [Acidobacteriota bacterium]REK00916.1 MAG: GNAT family N-acetyltransferase [Acidobacteriota bacterium]
MADPTLTEPSEPSRPAGLVLRRAVPDDVDALVALICEAYLVERYFVSGPRTDRAEIEDLMRRGEFLVLEVGGRLIASVYLEERAPSALPAGSALERVGYFGLLSVDPSEQGAGLGRRLVGEAESWSRARGLGALELWTVDLRRELRSWYARLGFREVGTAPFEAPDRKLRPCHFVVLHKSLGGSELATAAG